MIRKSIFLILCIILITGSAYSGVSSKVNGKVIDEMTMQPVPGAIVKMILAVRRDSAQRFLDWETISDEKGEFSFDVPSIIASMQGDSYYFTVEKKGYMKYLPEYYSKYIKSDYISKIFNYFKVGEGQIKYFVIKLKKGGTIKGVIKKKIGETITPLETFGVLSTRNKLHDFFRDIKSYTIRGFDIDKNGIFEIKNLETANDYIIELFPKDYVHKEIRNITVKQNDVTNIEYIFDQSNRTGIKGVVTWNNSTIEDGVLIIMKKKIPPPFVRTFESEKNGNFEYHGIFPGSYELEINYYGLKDNIPHIFKKKIFIKILSGQTRVLNININDYENE